LVFLGQAVAEYEGVHRKGCDPANADGAGASLTRPALQLAREKIATRIMAVPFLASSKAAYINGESLITHWFLQGKGGVGKSLAACLLAQYLPDKSSMSAVTTPIQSIALSPPLLP
jgi:hypothetical protein